MGSVCGANSQPLAPPVLIVYMDLQTEGDPLQYWSLRIVSGDAAPLPQLLTFLQSYRLWVATSRARWARTLIDQGQYAQSLSFAWIKGNPHPSDEKVATCMQTFQLSSGHMTVEWTQICNLQCLNRNCPFPTRCVSTHSSGLEHLHRLLNLTSPLQCWSVRIYRQ